MQLEPHEVKRFYDIWFPLLHYVNLQQQILPYFPNKRGSQVPSEDAALLRDALWDDDSLREGFIKENPANLPAEDLALVESWEYHIFGDFLVFRYLKKHTVLLSTGSPAHAYSVLGLVDPIKDILGPSLPRYVKTTLLPFEGRIIYDGIMGEYSISFGSGYRSSCNDSYRAIQEREGIITTLTPDPEASRPENVKKAIQARNKKLLRVFQKELGKSGLSPKKMEEHTANIAAFGEDFLLVQDSSHGLIETTLDDVRAYLETTGKKVNLVSFKRFARFLRDTGRIDYYEVEGLLEFLKRKG